MMIYQMLVALHVAAGTVSLISGAAALMLKKGSRRHRLSGKIYFWSMVMVCLSSTAIFLLNPNVFLFYLSLFTLCLLLPGMRPVYSRLKSKMTGLLMIGCLSVISLVMIQTVNPVLMGFGLLGMFLSLRQWQSLRAEGHESSAAKRLPLHVIFMCSSYIAAATAFVVNTIQTEGVFSLLLWFLPTVLLVPVIFYWTGRLKRSDSLRSA